MSEEHSRRDKGKRVIKRAVGTFTTATGALSGKNVQQQIAEYSELYTQVLLGLHRDLDAQDRKRHEHESEIEALKREIATIRDARNAEAAGTRLQDTSSEIETLKYQVASMGGLRILAAGAFVMALVALGVALWAAF